MSKRFIITTLDGNPSFYKIVHDFTVDDTWAAAIAFRTLYGEQPQYVLFEQVAVTDPGSHTEADDANSESDV